MNTQKELVLDYLQKHSKGITSMDAFKKFGATRLSAIIYDLRDEGYKIVTTNGTGKNRYGRTVNFAIYQLMK